MFLSLKCVHCICGSNGVSLSAEWLWANDGGRYWLSSMWRIEDAVFISNSNVDGEVRASRVTSSLSTQFIFIRYF